MHRLFVAIRPPEPIRDLLVDAMDDGTDFRWQHDEQFRLLMVTLAAILPLKQPSLLADEEFGTKVLELTDGNTGRIFRLIENLAIRAIGRGRETIGPEDLDADDLVLPTVTMKEIAKRQGRRVSGAPRAV